MAVSHYVDRISERGAACALWLPDYLVNTQPPHISKQSLEDIIDGKTITCAYRYIIISSFWQPIIWH